MTQTPGGETTRAASSDRYLARFADHTIEHYLESLPGLLIVGPRAVGKTTTAGRHAKTIIRLDKPSEAEPFTADADAALRGLEEPVLIDEWQLVPEVLGAIKRSIDDDMRPGRYIVTGSVRAELSTPTWPGTGRLVRVPMFGLTVREQLERSDRSSLMRKLIEEGTGAHVSVRDAPDLRGYLELALRSGFPDPALRLDSETRRLWLRGYIDQVVTRDIDLIAGRRDANRLRRFLNAYAATTATTVTDVSLARATGINIRTALSYERLLEDLFVVNRIPAWAGNPLKQLTRSAKRYISDPAIAASITRASVTDLMRGSGLLGALVETFGMAQLRAELASIDPTYQIAHLRSAGGRHEVDAVIDLGPNGLIAIELKAASAASRAKHARHLVWMRDELGSRFTIGIVFHTGPRTYELDERILALPLAALWS